jgi:RNA polymerase sigma-70 factor (ECF subfamily)
MHANAHEQIIRERHATGDLRGAAALILQTYGPQIRRFLARRTPGQAAADEAYAEFVFDLWRALPGFRWECPVRVWSYTLARRAMIRCNRRARQRAHREVPLSHSGLGEVGSPRTEPRAALPTSTRRRVEALWQALPDEDRRLLVLRITRDLAWKEIACLMTDGRASEEALETQTARLRKRFQLIKAKLRKLASASALSAGAKANTAVLF